MMSSCRSAIAPSSAHWAAATAPASGATPSASSSSGAQVR